MEKRLREKIALVMLVLLGLGIAGAMAWYILVGHGWNQAATHIDDMVGSMDGYTVVLFDGVVKKPKEKPAKSKSAASKSSAAKSPSDDSSASGASSGEASAGGEPASASSSDETSAGSEPASASSPDDSSASSASASTSASSAKSATAKHRKVQISQVAASYRNKGAETLIVNLSDLHRYSDTLIVKRGSKRIGILSSSGPYRMHLTSIRAKIRYLHKHAVDLVIVIGDDRSMLTDKIQGADLLLLAKGGGLSGAGGYRGSLFCVDSPYRGEVQSVIISPSNVMTARTIKPRE